MRRPSATRRPPRPGRASGPRSVRGRVALLALAAVLALSLAGPAVASAGPGDGRPHRVSWDGDSMRVDGQRIFSMGGEFDYWRLPSPELWTDVLEKIRAGGFNTISVYFHWGYHSPRRGIYDFSGVRDVDRLLRIAERLGLYVLARPGPYINAATEAGGLPPWVLGRRGPTRSRNPRFMSAAREWLHHIDAILARHQITRGGSVLAYQIENEYVFGTLDHEYMAELERTVRGDGINVPLFHDDTSVAGHWTRGRGAVNLYAANAYPLGFVCDPPDHWRPRVARFDHRAAEFRRLGTRDPIFIPEFQGGVIDGWGGTGYDACRRRTGVDYTRVFMRTALAQEARLINVYMLFGGTNWGWLPGPGAYTSFDYGAPITESRGLTDKYAEHKRINLFALTVAPLMRARVRGRPAGSNPAVLYRRLVDPRSGTQFLVLRHRTATSTTDATTTLTLRGRDGVYPRVPQRAGDAIRVQGRDAKFLVADYGMDGQRLVYSTSELMTHGGLGHRDAVILDGPRGETGETVLRYRSRPEARVVAGAVAATWDARRHDLRLDYRHAGLQRVLIHGGGRRPLVLWIGDTQAVTRAWRQPTRRGAVLVHGPELVREARVAGPTLLLRGDTDGPTHLRVLAPTGVTALRWNGHPVPVRVEADGALAGVVAGPQPAPLPALLTWRFHAEAPERLPGFDDSRWQRANHRRTSNPFRPGTLPVLYMDDYGFHHGDVWYRGSFPSARGGRGLRLMGRGGRLAYYSVWLNGRSLGTARYSHVFPFPPGALRHQRRNVVAVLFESMGHEKDFRHTGRGKLPRGLTAAGIVGASPPIAWRIQGAVGGERVRDRVRGAYNVGGLFGERHGWYEPGFADGGWPRVSLPHRLPEDGVGWYRTRFALNLPAGQDVSVGLSVTDAPCRYRAQIFLNGWHIGRYINRVGPQHVFALPTGILVPHGTNELAISVWGERHWCAGLGHVALTEYGNVLGG